MRLATRVQRVQPSPTLTVTALANRLRAEGRDVIGLAAGEPDFVTPEPIQQAAVTALKQGQTRYTAVSGTTELKQAVVDKFARENGLHYTPEQILVSCGAKHSCYNLCQALLDPGDQVVIPAPYWVSYPDMVRLADGEPVFIQADQTQGFKITPAQLEAAITERTRLLFLNSPNNPSGTVYSPAELQALADVLLAQPQVLIASDDIYEHILFGGQHFQNIVNVAPQLAERTLVINGVSKAYAMTGWRIGYAAGPAELIAAMTKIQSQSTSNPTAIAQAAAVAALNGDQHSVAEMRTAFEQRHALMVNALNQIPGVNCAAAGGTFYLFPSMHQAIEALSGVANDIQLAEFLLDRAGVAVVPGSAFGSPGHVRISFAASQSQLEAGAERIRQALTASGY